MHETGRSELVHWDPQHQEAERERQAVGQGAYGGRRGRVRGLGLAATAWAQGGPLSPVGPRWSGRHSAGALSSLALTRPFLKSFRSCDSSHVGRHSEICILSFFF